MKKKSLLLLMLIPILSFILVSATILAVKAAKPDIIVEGELKTLAPPPEPRELAPCSPGLSAGR